jgi:hypothetical protein
MRQHRSLHNATSATKPYIHDDSIWVPVGDDAYRAGWIRQQGNQLFEVLIQSDEHSAARVVISDRGISEARRELRNRLKKLKPRR